MSVISAVSRKCSTLADGSLRIVVEISPVDALAAFQLFCQPETPMALARIQPQAAIKQAQDETIAADKPKRGLLSQWCALRCTEPIFWEFLSKRFIEPVSNEKEAKELIYRVCVIKSRAELDTNNAAAATFHNLIREKYAEYLNHNTIVR